MSRWGKPREWREGLCLFTLTGARVRVLKVHRSFHRTDRIRYVDVITLDERPTRTIVQEPQWLSTRDPTTRALAVRGRERGR